MSLMRAGRKRGMYSQTARVLRMLEHLASQNYGTTLVELAETFSITERQVRRDLLAMAEAGHELEAVTIRDRSAVRLSLPKSSALHLTVRERYSLLAVRRVFDVLKGTPFAEDVENIYKKLAASLPPDQ